MSHVLVARLDSLGDMLICGPAIRAVSAGADRVTVLAGPAGAAAARLLPGVDDVVVWDCPWILADPPPVAPFELEWLVARLAASALDEAVVLTSFHQSALPTALVLRLAGVARITAVSEDYPGALLDVRLQSPPEGPEPERMLAIARGAGAALPPGDGGGLAVREGLPEPVGLPPGRFMVVHPGVTAPARSYPAPLWEQVVATLTARQLRGGRAHRRNRRGGAAAGHCPGLRRCLRPRAAGRRAAKGPRGGGRQHRPGAPRRRGRDPRGQPVLPGGPREPLGSLRRSDRAAR